MIVYVGEMLDNLVSNPPMAIHTPQDLRATATVLDTVVKAKELLEGRATSRVSVMTDEEIDDELAEGEADVIAKYEVGKKPDTLH